MTDVAKAHVHPPNPDHHTRSQCCDSLREESKARPQGEHSQKTDHRDSGNRVLYGQYEVRSGFQASTRICMSCLSALLLLAQPQAILPLGLESLYRLDQLPMFRNGVKFGAVTSYDRSGGNDDGFSGKYSFVRKEGDTLVLADLTGPGCVTRMHTPTATGELLEFYLDGSLTPAVSMPYRDYFTGDHFPFVQPVVGWAAGGAYSYLPISYQKSCKIVLRAPRTQFYDINYVQYLAGTKVKTFALSDIKPESIEKVKTVWTMGAAKDAAEFNQPAGSKKTRIPFDKLLLPGKTLTLLDTHKGGRIASIKLGPAISFQGRARDTLLRITWDGERSPSILMPVGDFFGYAFGKPSMESAFIGTTGTVNYCHLPMPFAKAAKVELVSTQTSGAGLPIQGEIVVGSIPLRTGEGRFYATWKREKPTTRGKPFTWLQAQGKGHIVGLSLQAQGKDAGIPTFFEGDDKTMADGIQAVHGTGSEDFFNGGWYALPGRWDRTLSLPVSGSLLYQESTGRTGGYRFLLNDAYSYEKTIEQTIEHGPENNAVITDYTGVTYFYADRPLTTSISTLSSEARRVVDPTKLIFSVHSNLPLDTFGLEGCTITRDGVKVGNGNLSALSVSVANTRNFAVAHVGLRTDFPAAGHYKVYGEFVKAADGGIVCLSNGTKALGPQVDLYSAESTHLPRVFLGDFTAKEGENALFIHFVGKNPASKGNGAHIRFLFCEKQ